ncbi:MAG: methyltransferase domain-containing protein [Beijerinckiaceae bacterium]
MAHQLSPCPVCHAHDASVISEHDRHGKPLTTRLCEACGHVFNDPVPSAEELAAFYARDYRVSYKGAARPRGRQIARNFQRVARFWSNWGHVIRNHARVLDIGAGSGEFLFFAQSLGHDARGVEPNVGYAAWCRDELGLAVRTASIEDLETSAETYDFIRLNHVLEHLRDPVEALERAAERLSPDGVLYVEVPDILGYAANKSHGRIFHYGHISNFSPWTLRAAAGRAGLVELAETAGEMQNGASAFFRKGDRWTVERTINAANAERVRASLAAHEARAISPLNKAARMARKLSNAINDARIAAGIGAPRMIGAYYVARLKGARSYRAPSPMPAGLTPSRT